MHSAEHILNQTMVRTFGCERSFNNHIEKKKSKCDYHFRMLADAEIKLVEIKVNEVIDSDLSVTEEFLDRTQAMSFLKLDRLPDDAGETIRVIKIGDYDACPCSGPHVKKTKEIGHFQIISASCENEVLRIRFKLK